MKNLRQEKSLRDHEPYLRGLSAIADPDIARGRAPSGELPLSVGGADSEWCRGGEWRRGKDAAGARSKAASAAELCPM
jgi:hypothetical protein